MSTSRTRKALLSAGTISALALAVVGCGNSADDAKDTASDAASSVSAAASDAAQDAKEKANDISYDKEAFKSEARTEDGYHLNKVVKDAPTVTLYTDYQCPYCGKIDPTFNDVAKKLEGEMNVTVKHFPLPMHDYAAPAAHAVQAAENQGKHTEMVEAVFKHQEDWKQATNADAVYNDFFAKYAEELKLDMDQFKTDYNSELTKNLVETDYKSGENIDVKGTPTVAVNGKVLENVESSTPADEIVSEAKKAAENN